MWQTISVRETCERLKTNSVNGLTKDEAEERIKKYGENKLTEKKKESILVKFLKQFNDFMIIILIIAAAISAVMSYVEGSNDYLDSVIIIFIVVLNAIMGIIQEAKAEKSLDALKKMSAPTAKVKRDGIIQTIPSEEVVPGDLIIIETGSYIPADARIVKSYNLKVEESALTGETIPVLKDERALLSEKAPIGDMINMVFGATIAVARTCRSNSNTEQE